MTTMITTMAMVVIMTDDSDDFYGIPDPKEVKQKKAQLVAKSFLDSSEKRFGNVQFPRWKIHSCSEEYSF